jgi:hypothetical protein
MTTTMLSLSLLNGQLKAVAFNRGKVTGQWECPEPVSDFSGFAPTLRKIIEETHYTGNQASLVLAHPRLTQQLIETPPVKGWNLRAFLERRVKQFKASATDAAWSYQPTLPAKNAQTVLLHLTSKSFLDQLAQACRLRGLRLTTILPATVVLSRQLAQLPVSNDEVVLLAAETGSGTSVVVGRRDGRIYLGRSLSSSWKTSPERVNTDLNRTVLYIKQQFGTTVNSVWLFGQGAEEQSAALQAVVGVSVQLSPVAPEPFYWNLEAARLSADAPGNLITVEQQKAPQRRVLARVTAVMIVVLAIAALVIAAVVQTLARDRQVQLEKLGVELAGLQERKGKLDQREAALQRQKDFIRIVSEEKVPAVAGWFLGHLGHIVPGDLLLTNLDVKLDNDLWRVQLAGTVQPAMYPDSAELAITSVAALMEELAGGPFHLEISREGSDQQAGASLPRSGATRSGQSGDSNAGEAGSGKFSLEGVMR